MEYYLKDDVTEKQLLAVGFDKFLYRYTRGNCALLIKNRKVTYGTWTTSDIYKVHKKDIQDLINLGYIKESETK